MQKGRKIGYGGLYHYASFPIKLGLLRTYSLHERWASFAITRIIEDICVKHIRILQKVLGAIYFLYEALDGHVFMFLLANKNKKMKRSGSRVKGETKEQTRSIKFVRQEEEED